MGVRVENIARPASKQRALTPPAYPFTDSWKLSPEGGEGGSKAPGIWQLAAAAGPRGTAQLSARAQDTGPRELRGIWRKELSEPRLLHLPVHRIVLSSLTRDIWLSLIHKNAFNIQTTCPLLEDFCVT